MNENQDFPDGLGDPVIELLLSGTARTIDEAEEMYLDDSMQEILDLVGSDLSEEELCRHPLMTLLRSRGSRGWEDSIT